MSSGLAYLPIEELGDRPHVLVDGATRPGSVLTLSHWPQSPTPAVLARDLSAEIVLAFLHARSGELSYGGRRSRREALAAVSAARRAEAVTNDHFDEDGLVAVFALASPEVALGHEGLLVEVASCGDFGVVHSREAARIAFSLGPIAEEAVAAAPPGSGERPGSWSGPRYRAVLERFVELVEHSERFRRFWERPEAAFEAARDEICSGAVRIEEVPEVDLAIVTRAPRADASSGLGGREPLDEVAVHSATNASRILSFDDGRCELHLRYESWVRYVSRQVPLRPDLGPLADELSAAEPSRVGWTADGVGALVTRMRPRDEGKTGLSPEVISRTVVDYLRRAPAAWDPFRADGALIPFDERRLLL